MTRRLNTVLAVFVLVVGFPLYWYFINAGTGHASPRPLSIETLRKLATAIEGPAPSAVRYEAIAHRDVSGNRLVAGTGLRSRRYTVRAYQLAVPGAAPIQIDAGIAPGQAVAGAFKDFDSQAQQRVERALAKAGHIALLGETPSHVGALSWQDDPRVFRPDGQPRAIAPGVVSIPLQGMPGKQQMIYARLKNGREYLFTGDIAISDRAWRELRPPARYETDFVTGVDRETIASWLMTINALHRQAPDMTVVPGQQPGNLKKQFQLHRGFPKPLQSRLQNAGQATGHEPRDNVLGRQKS